MTALLHVQDLGQAFGEHAVFQSVSFELHAGQHLAVLGPSGCGKSTLLRLLAGLDAPTEGRIWLDGRLVSEPGRILVPPHERKLSMVFQDLALWPALSVLENVMLGLAQPGLSRAQRRERALETLKIAKVGELGERKPGTLSIGQQQRVALARAVAALPRLLLLDEPFSSLDPAMKADLLAEVQAWACNFGMALVLITHDLFEALAICKNGLVIEDGGAKEHGDLLTLLTAPESGFVRACARQLKLVADSRLAR